MPSFPLKNVSGHPVSFIVPGGRSIDVENGEVISLTERELASITDPKCKWGGEVLACFEEVRKPKAEPKPSPPVEPPDPPKDRK